MPVRVALLGSGLFAAHSYLPAIPKSREVHLDTVWSRSQSSAQALVDKFKEGGESPAVSFGQDGYQALLSDGEIQAFLVVLPISVQPGIVLDALEAGKHVLSEKPIAKDGKTARETIFRYETCHKPKGVVWRAAESFLLDGGVHQMALLRVILPVLPKSVVSAAYLYRKHLPPHDTIVALALPPDTALHEAHGEETKVQGVADKSVIPTGVGQSGPAGTIVLGFGDPDFPSENGDHGQGFVITTLHARVEVSWGQVKVIRAESSGIEHKTRRFPTQGVATEIDMFARAAAGRGKDEPNWGDVRGALWDLAMIEAMLTSEGKQVDLDPLIAGR